MDSTTRHQENEHRTQLNKQPNNITMGKVRFADPPTTFTAGEWFSELTPEEAQAQRAWWRPGRVDTTKQDEDREKKWAAERKDNFLKIQEELQEKLEMDMVIHPGRNEPLCLESGEHLVLDEQPNCHLCGIRVVFEDL